MKKTEAEQCGGKKEQQQFGSDMSDLNHSDTPFPMWFYVNRIRWIWFDLLTQIPDMDGNRVAGAVIVRFLPDCFIEPLWRENLSAVGKQ